MLRNYEYHFEVKPGKFVFVPTEACLKVGAEIVNQVTMAWRPHNIFYHLENVVVTFLHYGLT